METRQFWKKVFMLTKTAVEKFFTFTGHVMYTVSHDIALCFERLRNLKRL